jgi:hypothetical protein
MHHAPPEGQQIVMQVKGGIEQPQVEQKSLDY